MANRLDGLNPLAYRGVRATTPPQMIVENRAPTQNDLANRVLGTQWSYIIDGSEEDSRQYMLASVEQNIAVWVALDSDEMVELPDHSVALGTGEPGLNSTGPEATLAYVLASNGANADPSFQAPEDLITMPNHSVILGTGAPGLNSTGPIATLGAPLVSNGNAADPSFGVASVSGGGTGLNDCDPYAVYCGGLTSEGPLQQVAGLGTSGQVLTSNGLAMLPTWEDLGGSGVIVTIYDTPGSGTHDLDSGTLALSVIGFSAGGGGGSGRQGNSTDSGGGGGGGNGGTFYMSLAPVEYFGGAGASVAYEVGAGGAGGASQAVPGTDGNAGVAGGATSFGKLSVGGTGLEAFGGAGGSQATVAGGINSYCLNMNVPGMVISGGGGAGNLADGSDGISSQASTIFPGSGGGGGGANAGTERAGGSGASILSYEALGLNTVIAGGTGGLESVDINGGAGNDGDSDGSYFTGGSGGGGGGGQHVGAAAGDGGVGGFPGGGGGGGGGSLTGTDSGAGGAGGDGALIIVEYLAGGGTPPPPSGSVQINTIVYDTPGAGVYTPTAGMTQCIVECVGAGGGSAGITAGTNGGAGGGGAGGYCKKLFDAATIGASQNYVIGAGGAGAGVGITQGGNGVDTTFGALLGATGGNGSGVNPADTLFWLGGVGGTGSGGEINVAGQSGHNASSNAFYNNYSTSGMGGSGIYGAGGKSVPSGSTPTRQAGNPGTGYGGGASGGYINESSSTFPGLAGADGASGVIVITEYIST